MPVLPREQVVGFKSHERRMTSHGLLTKDINTSRDLDDEDSCNFRLPGAASILSMKTIRKNP